MSKVKVALAQINFKPAFYSNQLDMILEPYGDTTTSISNLTYNGSDKLKNNVRNIYISWLRSKIINIVKKAIQLEVDLLVFPEYSIPPEILKDMVLELATTKMYIVAGTHIVTSKKLELPKGYPDNKGFIGYAMCPILSNQGIFDYTFKTRKAKPEISLKVPKSETNDIFDLGKFKIQIKICIDAISTGEVFKFNIDNKGILVVPSWSMTTEPFKALSVYSRFNEIPVIYSNCAAGGGSIISGAFSEYDNHWFSDKSMTKAIPKDNECLLTAYLDLDRMFSCKGTTNSEPAISIGEVVNIFYSREECIQVLVDNIEDYLQELSDEKFEYLKTKNQDIIMSEKLRYLNQMHNNGLIDEQLARATLNYIKINNVNFRQLMFDQSKIIINNFCGSMQQNSGDKNILTNMATISAYIAKFDDIAVTSSNIFEDKLFIGRDTDISNLSDFFNSDDSVLLIRGLRGIGKTKLLEKICSTILPTPSPWDVYYIELTDGIGFERLIDEILYNLDIPYMQLDGIPILTIVENMFKSIDERVAVALVIDDVHYCTEKSGVFFDSRIKEFLIGFIKKANLAKNFKLILTTNRRIHDLEIMNLRDMEVSRLKDELIQTIISFYYRKITNSIYAPTINKETIKIIFGNPLAAIIASQILADDCTEEFEINTEPFNKFQEQLIKNLLGGIKLSNDEITVMNILSLSKTTIDINFVTENIQYLLPSVYSLTNRFLIEKNEDTITIHPLFKEYYYNLLEIKERTEYHKLFANYYEKVIANYEKKSKIIPPDILSNAIYHSAGSLEFNKLSGYKNKYIEEVKPVADRLYRDKDYDNAVRYYRMIYDAVGISRGDILIKMAQCYVYCDDIKSANEFFKLACESNPRGAYLWANYAISLASKKQNIRDAIKCSLEAEEVYRKYKNSLDWELALIKFAQAKAYRFNDIEKALKLYEEVCSIDSTNTYYLCVYSQFLYTHGDRESAIKKLKIAEEIDSTYYLIERLKTKFKEENIEDHDLEIDIDYIED